MVQIETLCLFILGIHDKRVHGDFGPTGTLYGIPQQDTPEFTAMIGESDGKAPQARDGYCRIARQAFGKSDWHLCNEHATRSQCIEAGNPICRDLAGHEASRDSAARILAGLLPEIAIERIHAARKLRTIVAWPKWLYYE
jgi:hypothetical protein